MTDKNQEGLTKTGIIKYNLADRGRVYRGQDRNFDFSKVIEYINSPECQERVKKRDMLGMYGHAARIRFGIDLTEKGVDEKGRMVALEPAIVTVYLKAHPDGTIEHQEEFLKTEDGKIAERMYLSRVGGFSSAMTPSDGRFYGFDYVQEPNYSTNRGYQLDSVGKMTESEFMAAFMAERTAGLCAVLDSVQGVSAAQEATIQQLTTERDHLLEFMASKGMDPDKPAAPHQTTATVPSGRLPKAVYDSADRLIQTATNWHRVSMKDIPRVQEAPSAPPPENDPIVARLLRGY